MKIALSLGLQPTRESNSRLYGEHYFDLKKIYHDEPHSIEAFKRNIELLKAVGRPLWSHFWFNPEENIPSLWEKYILVFGDIFIDKEGREFFLTFIFKDEWNFSFPPIEECLTLPQNARLVCLDE
ncbi:MAG: hypothetical protein WC677_08870 [Clostridia bacterium]|jgi:hypothetical protein